jgi:hypothetical protein
LWTADVVRWLSTANCRVQGAASLRNVTVVSYIAVLGRQESTLDVDNTSSGP